MINTLRYTKRPAAIRIKDYRERLTYRSLEDLLDALGLQSGWGFSIEKGDGNIVRDCRITKNGRTLVEYCQYMETGYCLVKRIFRLLPKFSYDEISGNWCHHTDCHQILDLVYDDSIRHCLSDTESTPAQVFNVLERVRTAVNKFRDTARLVCAWLDAPRNITGKEWRKLHWCLKRSERPIPVRDSATKA